MCGCGSAVRAHSLALRQAQDEGRGRERLASVVSHIQTLAHPLLALIQFAPPQALILSLSKGEGGMMRAIAHHSQH